MCVWGGGGGGTTGLLNVNQNAMRDILMFD